MVSTFVNPTVNPESRLGVRSFDETDPIRRWPGATGAEVQTVIRAIYRHVLGNAHVMESERLTALESQLTQGDISVREFVRQLAKSELYRTRFFQDCPRSRTIELNFKHLLGRPPESYEEVIAHTQILDRSGYEAEIDSYVDSDEYHQVFGEDTVPYYRGYKTQTGRPLVGFTHMFKLLRGSSASDHSRDVGSFSRLNRVICSNIPSMIIPPTNIAPGWHPMAETPPFMRSQSGISSSITTISLASTSDVAGERELQKQYQGLQAFDTPPVELYPGFSAEDIDVVIRAVYRQVFGNAHVMESERLVVPESQLKHGELSVREFVRQLAKSDLYRSRFFDTLYRYRAIELNFKHLLGRAPHSFEEMKYHSTVLDTAGFEADIDSYLDGDEYQEVFGENVVPYYRGYKTQTGQPLVGFTHMLKLLRSASSSDKGLASDNKPQLAASILSKATPRSQSPVDVTDIIREALKPKVKGVQSRYGSPTAAEQALRQTIQTQAQTIDRLQQQLADLRPLAGIGAAQLRDGWAPSVLPEGIDASAPWQQQVDWQTSQIATLEAQVADARRYATIAEARLNKWRSRVYNG
ncbi:MAG: phycobilisome rod-core linker polypeptide [Cyanobacteria bacterium J06639_14]